MQYSKKSEGLRCFKTGGTKVQYLNPVPLNILWYYQPCYLLWNFLKCNCYLFWCSLFLSILLLYNWDISTYLLFVENKCFHKNFPIYYDIRLQNRPLSLSINTVSLNEHPNAKNSNWFTYSVDQLRVTQKLWNKYSWEPCWETLLFSQQDKHMSHIQIHM